MIKLICLTKENGDPVYVNFNAIAALEKDTYWANNVNNPGTGIQLLNDLTPFRVRETLDEVLTMIYRQGD